MFTVDLESGADRSQHQVALVRDADRALLAADGVSHSLRWLETDGLVNLTLDGRHYLAHVARRGDVAHVQLNGRVWSIRIHDPVQDAEVGAETGDICAAPMPGQIVAIKVRQGEKVTQGQTVAVLESMKMQVAIEAQRDGVVAEIQHAEGESVDRDAVLVRLLAKESP